MDAPVDLEALARETRALAIRALAGNADLVDALLPFGGHKGYALALAMHALGVLCGGAADQEIAGYLFIAFKPDLFVPLEDYRRALAAEIAAIKATPRQEGVDEIRIPGERAYRERARLTREGLGIDRRVYQALIALAEGKRGAFTGPAEER